MCSCPTPYLTVFFIFDFPLTTSFYISFVSLHDALPICTDLEEHVEVGSAVPSVRCAPVGGSGDPRPAPCQDRKSTRLNSSHVAISYAVFCLKKKTRYIVRCYEFRCVM